MERVVLFFVTFLTFVAPLVAQHSGHKEPPATHDEEKDHYPHHRLALFIGHTRIAAGSGGEKLLIPSWGLDYEWWFNKKWAIGLHTDLENSSFVVREPGHEAEVERDYPLVISIDALWRPWKGLVLQVGPGMELERNKSYGLIRTGLEYEFDLPRHWDISPTLFYDHRFNAYDTWTIALGVGKRF